MTCDAIRDGELIEAYLLGHLTEDEQARFEAHYFECERCFEALETVRALRLALASPAGTTAGAERRAGSVRQPAWRLVAWAAAAGGVVLAGALAVWVVRSGAPGDTAGRAAGLVAEAPPALPPAEAPTDDVTPPPASVDGPVQPAQPVAPPSPSLAELARFDPPPFFAFTVRGDAGPPTDDAFAGAMARYMERDYRQARSELAALVERDPSVAAAHFYLAMAALQLGDVDQGIGALRATLALGESPYFEDANFFLAKARLRQGDVAGAREALDRTIGLAGEREAEARRLLKQIADR